MKPPTAKLRRAAAKRMRAQGGPREEQQAPAPKHLTVRIPQPPEQREPPIAPEVDLTADTPPKEVVAEGATTEESQVPAKPAPAEAERSWGEGPSAEASPPPEQMPVNSPPHAEPETAEAVGGSGVRPKPPRDSILNDGRWAKQLVSQIIVPEVQEELSHLKVATFFQESYAALAKLANTLAATRDVINGGKTLIRQAQQEAKAAQARAEVAEEARESAKAERANEIRATESRAETEANRLRAALSQLMEAEGAIEARNLHIAELNSAVQEAEVRAKHDEEEAEHAKEAEKMAASLVTKKETRIAKVEAAAEARAIVAVEEFKASEHFANELVEANANSYIQGFRDAREKMARVLDLPRALEIEPDQEFERAPSDDEPVTDP